MVSKVPELDASPYWTQMRRDLVQWFSDRAPEFADGYVAAVRLLHTPEYPARSHLVCHIVRDIYRFLPSAFGQQSQPRPAEVIVPMVKDLAGLWEMHQAPATADREGIGETVLLHSRVYALVENIVSRIRGFGKQPSVGSQLATALYRSMEHRADEFVPQWIIKAFDAEYDYFVTRAHLNSHRSDDDLMNRFESFERAFHSLVGPYFGGKEELDAILQATNTRSD